MGVGISGFHYAVAHFWPKFHLHDLFPDCGQNCDIKNAPKDYHKYERIVEASFKNLQERHDQEASQESRSDP